MSKNYTSFVSSSIRLKNRPLFYPRPFPSKHFTTHLPPISQFFFFQPCPVSRLSFFVRRSAGGRGHGASATAATLGGKKKKKKRTARVSVALSGHLGGFHQAGKPPSTAIQAVNDSQLSSVRIAKPRKAQALATLAGTSGAHSSYTLDTQTSATHPPRGSCQRPTS